MEKKKKEEPFAGIPYRIVIYNILIYYKFEVNDDDDEVENYYGYFSSDYNRKLLVIFKSIKLRLFESQCKVIQINPNKIVNLEIQPISEIKQNYIYQILNKTNIKSLTIDGKWSRFGGKLIISNFSIFKNLEQLSIVRKECYIVKWNDVTYNIKYLHLESDDKSTIYTFDCKVLKNFVNLKTMIMKYINIENFEFLSEVKTLEKLYIIYCTISTKGTAGLCLFYEMPKLKRIILDGYEIQNIEFLNYNDNLTIFSIGGIDLIKTNLKGISKCRKLERLEILKDLDNIDFFSPFYNTELSKLVFLSLKYLDISSSLTNLGILKSLRALKLSWVPELNYIDGINRFKNLIMLNLEYTEIETLDNINLPMLLYIYLSNTYIKSLSPLSTSTRLLALNANNIPIEKIDVELPNLRALNVSCCSSLRDISGINKFKKLEFLSIYGSPVEFNHSLHSSLKKLKVVVTTTVSYYTHKRYILVNDFDMETPIESFEGISNLDFNI